MATQNLTVQTDQPLPTMGRATVAEIEATGKMTAELLTQLKSSKQPVFLNLDDGQTKVVLDVSDYQRLVESVGFLEAETTPETLATAPSEAELVESRAAVKRGLADVAAGRTRPIEEFFEELEKKHPFLAGVAETL